MTVEFMPKSHGGCACMCHFSPHVKHFAACCYPNEPDNKMSFDQYCEEYNIRQEEMGPAFGAYLNYLTNGDWDGESSRVE